MLIFMFFHLVNSTKVNNLYAILFETISIYLFIPLVTYFCNYVHLGFYRLPVLRR